MSSFFLNAFEEEAELNSLEPKTAGVLVIGIDSGAARSVVLAGEIPGYLVEKDSETGRVYTSATGERVFDQGEQQILGAVDGKVRGLNMRVAQVKKSLTSVYDMCAAGHRVVFDFDDNKRDQSHAENKLNGERSSFKLISRVWELEMKIIPKEETEDILTKMQAQSAEELCTFRVAGTVAVSPEDPVGSGLVRHDREREAWPRRQSTTKCPLIMTLHASPEPPEPELCLSVRRGKKEMITMPWVSVTLRRLQESSTLPDPGHEVVLDTRRWRLLMCCRVRVTAHPWCVQALVRAIVATGDAKITFPSDNEPAIPDLKRQATAECRVRHGITVIMDDTTEYRGGSPRSKGYGATG